MFLAANTVQLDPQVGSLLVGTVVPLLVGLLSKSRASSGLKAILNAVLSVLAGATVAAATGPVEIKTLVVGAISAWVTSVSTYYGLWKPSGVSTAVSNTAPGTGVG